MVFLRLVSPLILLLIISHQLINNLLAALDAPIGHCVVGDAGTVAGASEGGEGHNDFDISSKRQT